jgi:hypothetical protein
MRTISIKDTALVAILQAGVVIGGVILAELSDKRFLRLGLPEPRLLSVLADYGLLALTIPLVWTAIILHSRHSADMKISIFYVGLISVAVLAL